MIKKFIIILFSLILLISSCSGGDDDENGDDSTELNESGTSVLLELTPADTGSFSAYGRTQFKITSTGSCYIAFDLLSSDKNEWFGTMNHGGTKSLFVYNLQEGQYYIESDDSGTCDWKIEISSLGIDESLPYHTGQDPENKPDNNYSSSPGGSPVIDNSGNNDTDNADDDTGPCGSDQYDCSDFTACADVMAIFNSCSYDVHGLDGNGDGIPCEDLCFGNSTAQNEEYEYLKADLDDTQGEQNEASEGDTVSTDTGVNDSTDSIVETANGYAAQSGHNEQKSFSDNLEEQQKETEDEE